MPWVLAEYLNVTLPEHDHEFSVRFFASQRDAILWARAWDNSPGVCVKLMELSGGTANTHPSEIWIPVRPATLIHFYDGITPAPPEFRWGEGMTHNHSQNIVVGRWVLAPNGTMIHNCNRNRTWRSRGTVRPQASSTRYMCRSCYATVTERYLRQRATNIVISERR